MSLKSGAGEKPRCCASTSLRAVQQLIRQFKKQAPASTTSDTGPRPCCLTPATDLVSSSSQAAGTGHQLASALPNIPLQATRQIAQPQTVTQGKCDLLSPRKPARPLYRSAEKPLLHTCKACPNVRSHILSPSPHAMKRSG